MVIAGIDLDSNGVHIVRLNIDDNHAIVSSSVGPEYYVGVMSFVNQDMLEPGCSVLLHDLALSIAVAYETRAPAPPPAIRAARTSI